MSTQTVAMTCFALVAALLGLAAVSLLGGPALAGPFPALFGVTFFASPVLAVVTGLNLMRRTPDYS
jgi:hypothetical protein